MSESIRSCYEGKTEKPPGSQHSCATAQKLVIQEYESHYIRRFAGIGDKRDGTHVVRDREQEHEKGRTY